MPNFKMGFYKTQLSYVCFERIIFFENLFLQLGKQNIMCSSRLGIPIFDKIWVPNIDTLFKKKKQGCISLLLEWIFPFDIQLKLIIRF